MARDKVCVVIGAGDATGGAIARRFAREGFTAVVTRRSADKLKHLVARITREGGKVHPFGSDARDEEQVTKLFREIETEIGDIEVFVFNIGGNVRFGSNPCAATNPFKHLRARDGDARCGRHPSPTARPAIPSTPPRALPAPLRLWYRASQ